MVARACGTFGQPGVTVADPRFADWLFHFPPSKRAKKKEKKKKHSPMRARRCISVSSRARATDRQIAPGTGRRCTERTADERDALSLSFAVCLAVCDADFVIFGHPSEWVVRPTLPRVLTCQGVLPCVCVCASERHSNACAASWEGVSCFFCSCFRGVVFGTLAACTHAREKRIQRHRPCAWPA